MKVMFLTQPHSVNWLYISRLNFRNSFFPESFFSGSLAFSISFLCLIFILMDMNPYCQILPQMPAFAKQKLRDSGLPQETNDLLWFNWNVIGMGCHHERQGIGLINSNCAYLHKEKDWFLNLLQNSSEANFFPNIQNEFPLLYCMTIIPSCVPHDHRA